MYGACRMEGFTLQLKLYKPIHRAVCTVVWQADVHFLSCGFLLLYQSSMTRIPVGKEILTGPLGHQHQPCVLLPLWRSRTSTRRHFHAIPNMTPSNPLKRRAQTQILISRDLQQAPIRAAALPVHCRLWVGIGHRRCLQQLCSHQEAAKNQ
jgi:hypothetical protein